MTGTTGTPRVLVVDDERNIRRTLRMVLCDEDIEVEEATCAEEALARLQEPTGETSTADAGGEASTADAGGGPSPRIDLLITDIRMPGMSGLELIAELAARHGGTVPMPVIVISGHASAQDVLEATRAGAFDFFEKPVSRERVLVSVRNALQHARDSLELSRLRDRYGAELLGDSPPMRELAAQIDRVARTRARVLIHGESGTGKELVARAIHHASPRAREAFVKVNCAAIPAELIESELFGHEKGAFTGATAAKRGLFEAADKGTIFLDEIGDMSLEAQAKVLRVLQTGELLRVGSNDVRTVDVRVIAATHRDLEDMARQGLFREDLYFRLAVVPLHTPPLRERLEDLPALVRHFVRETCEEHGVAHKRLAPEVLHALSLHSWPGNVRELRNVLERAVILSDDDLTLTDLPVSLRELTQATEGADGGVDGGALDRGRSATFGTLEPPLEDTAVKRALMELLSTLHIEGLALDAAESLDLRSFREAIERAFILERLRETQWNVSRAAESLGLERSHLHKKMRLLNLRREDG